MRFNSSWLRNWERSARAARRSMTTFDRRRAEYRPLLEALEDRRLLSTVTVTSLGDSGAGTLRAAIAAAQDGDTIVFSLAKKKGNQSTNTPATIALKNSQLTVSKDLTIQGPGADQLTISGKSGGSTAFRVFEVAQGATVTLSGMTITNGWSQRGGGISNGGTLTLANCSIRGNQAVFGGGIFNGGSITISNSTVQGNSAEDGGGIHNAAGSLTLINSSVTGNHAQFGYAGHGRGGGIYNFGTVTISNSNLTGNTAVQSWEVGVVSNDIYNLGTVYRDSTSAIGSLSGNAPILI